MHTFVAVTQLKLGDCEVVLQASRMALPFGITHALIVPVLVMAGATAAVSSPPDFPAPIYTVDLDAPPRSRWTDAVLGQINRHGWEGTCVLTLSL